MGKTRVQTAGQSDAVGGAPVLSLWVRPEQLGVPEPCDDLVAMEQRLAQSASEAMLIYEQPTVAVARAILEGVPLGVALASWCRATRAVLAVLAKYRPRMVVLQAPVSDEVHAVLEARLLVALPKGVSDRVPPFVDLPDSALALAGVALRQDPEATDLMRNLQSATLGSPDDLASGAELLAALARDWRAAWLHAETRSVDMSAAKVRNAEMTAGLHSAQAQAKKLRDAYDTAQKAGAIVRDAPNEQVQMTCEELSAAKERYQEAFHTINILMTQVVELEALLKEK